MDKVRELAAPCGLDCFNCEVHINNVTDEMRALFSKNTGLPPEKVQCDGCRQQKGVRLGMPLCETYTCSQDKGVEFCYECDGFPCEKLMPASDGAGRYPHNIKLYNLCRIKAIGLDKWAKEASGIRRKYFTGKFIIGKGPVEE